MSDYVALIRPTELPATTIEEQSEANAVTCLLRERFRVRFQKDYQLSKASFRPVLRE